MYLELRVHRIRRIPIGVRMGAQRKLLGWVVWEFATHRITPVIVLCAAPKPRPRSAIL